MLSPSAITPRMIGRRATQWRAISGSIVRATCAISPSGVRIATAQLRGPRIITPSRTAWPPIACDMGSAPYARTRSAFSSRRWKRSTRPPVSTSFCLPV